MADFDVILRGGTILDGSGGEPWAGDVAIREDRIAALETEVSGSGTHEVDATGLAIAPGFVNMLSWAVESLIEDGRSMSDVRQGVTLEVMGEGTSMGPLNPEMKERMANGGLSGLEGYDYPVGWTTLCEYLAWLERRGVSTNIASFVGAGTLRAHAAGYDDRPLSDDELGRMCALLDEEMQAGAMGLASALIYPPETSYTTSELVRLCEVVAAHGGLYASHLRSEGTNLVESVDELVTIARQSGTRAEIYHLKATGRSNWPTLDTAIASVERARAEGLSVTADAYPYEFAGTTLTACFPPWAHDGGREALQERLRDASERTRIHESLAADTWENPFLDTGPENIRVSGMLAPDLAWCQGKSLAEIAASRGTTPADAAMDVVLENGGDAFALYFAMSPDDVRKVVGLPWVSICSDAESLAAEGRMLEFGIHPRAYGSFARVLGPFVRDLGVLTLPEAVRRMTSLPAENLRLRDRGRLRTGYLADVVAFDPATIADHATPTEPHAYAVGVRHVWVNGTAVLTDGEHTGATPGRFVRGPGWRG